MSWTRPIIKEIKPDKNSSTKFEPYYKVYLSYPEYKKKPLSELEAGESSFTQKEVASCHNQEFKTLESAVKACVEFQEDFYCREIMIESEGKTLVYWKSEAQSQENTDKAKFAKDLEVKIKRKLEEKKE